MSKTVMITGVTGQDGSYLAEMFLKDGHYVVGVARRSSVDTTQRLKELDILKDERLSIVEGDITDYTSMYDLIKGHSPDYIYNTAAQSHVQTSFSQPGYTWAVNASGVLNLLECIRKIDPGIRLLQCSTSEMFGKNMGTLHTVDGPYSLYYQNETTPFAPTSPYAVAKLAAHHTVKTYRHAYGLHASCAISFNHESELRGEFFVTRKITKWLAELCAYLKDESGHPIYMAHTLKAMVDSNNIPYNMKIHLGNVHARRDWSHARDIVRGMRLMVEHHTADDYVLSSGKTYSILDFMSAAFKAIGWPHYEEYVQGFIEIDPKFYRPSDVDYLCGDSTKARNVLGWEPQISFEELVRLMVSHDLFETAGLFLIDGKIR